MAQQVFNQLNNIPPTINVLHVILSDHEYNKLINENNSLKEQLLILTGREEQYKLTIDKNNKELEILREENIQLKKELEKLKELLKAHTDNINSLNDRLNEKDDIEISKKILIAIQDVNKNDILEKKLNSPFNSKLKKLRLYRNSNVHYIQDNINGDGDSVDVIMYKKKILFNKLNSIVPNISTQIDKKFGNNFIKEIKKYLENETLNITENNISSDDKEYCESWWCDVF